MATTRRSKAKRKTPAKARKRTAATRRKAAARPARKQSARGKRTAATRRKVAARPARKRPTRAKSEPQDNQTSALGSVEQMFDQAAKKTKRAARKVKNEIKDMLNI
jgi:hypothetical protein